MRRQWTSRLFVLLAMVIALSSTAQAQYSSGLPAGIVSVEVDSQPIDAVSVPTTDSATPRITGAVEQLVPAIELAVADGNIIRFPAGVNANGRFRAPVPRALADGVYSLYINDDLIGTFIVSGAPTTDREPGRLLDIARVVPYPADFSQVIPGIGFLDGRFFTLDEEAARTSAAGGESDESDVRTLRRQLAEAGWLQRYESRLAAPGSGDPRSFSVQISSFIVEYVSGADARSAFTTVVGSDAGEDFAQVGDESVLTLFSGSTPDTGTEFQAARLVYRVGSMLGMIIYADLENAEPDRALLEQIALDVAARGVVVADRQVAPLGSMILQIESPTEPDNVAQQDLYDLRGGEFTPCYGEDANSIASRTEDLSGATDVFSSSTSGRFTRGGRARDRSPDEAEAVQQGDVPGSPISVITIESGDASQFAATPEAERMREGDEKESTATVAFSSLLVLFPGEAEAETWLARQRDDIRDQIASGDTAYSEITDSPALGDATFAFATSKPIGDGDVAGSGYRIATRTGAIVATIEIVSDSGISARAVAGLMEEQLACIAAEGCSGPAALPASLFGE